MPSATSLKTDLIMLLYNPLFNDACQQACKRQHHCAAIEPLLRSPLVTFHLDLPYQQ